MRYFVELAYNGTAYSGWQRQPNAFTVQQCIEETISKILRTKIIVTGCGRTDTGVHASQYYLHFDCENELPEGFVKRANKVLPPDIVLYHLYEMDAAAHARFNATKRSYVYHLVAHKTPFRTEIAYAYPFFKKLNFDQLNAAASLLLDYAAFAPFCKTNSDAKTMDCQLFNSNWIFNENQDALEYHISANRFLRGMVRLIVGMQLNVGLGKVSLDQVKEALDNQTPLPKSYSVPPQGLFLSEVVYQGVDFSREH